MDREELRKALKNSKLTEEQFKQIIEKSGISEDAFFLIRHFVQNGGEQNIEVLKNSLVEVREKIHALQDDDLPPIYSFAESTNNQGLQHMIALDVERRKGEIKDWNISFNKSEVALFRETI